MATVMSHNLPILISNINSKESQADCGNMIMHNSSSDHLMAANNDRMSPKLYFNKQANLRLLAAKDYASSRLVLDERCISNGGTAIDDTSEARSSSVSSLQTDDINVVRDQEQDQDDDQMSCCSDDSDLSVGKEELETTGEDAGASLSPINKLSLLNNSKKCNDRMLEDPDNEGDHKLLSRPSAHPAINGGGLSLLPQSPTLLHEEFLKSSQLYAEELMRQQLSIVAAARGINISPNPLDKHPMAILSKLESFKNEEKKSFRPPITNLDNDLRYNGDKTLLSLDDRISTAGINTNSINNNNNNNNNNNISNNNNNHSNNNSSNNNNNNSVSGGGGMIERQENMNFFGIHSHLNAISQITQNFNNSHHDFHKITSPSLSSMTSRDSSQSPPNNLNPNHLINNNINDQNLKFSIDNILKADFGRRITDPLKRSKYLTKKAQKNALTASEKSVTLSPMDLTASNEKLSPNSTADTPPASTTSSSSAKGKDGPMVWPAWVYCTRYSDRPSSGPRTRKPKKAPTEKTAAVVVPEDKRPRTAFSGPQLARLKHEFSENRYLTERRRQQLSAELGLNEAQIKIWFQNKRAKIKKSSGHKNPLALQLMAQGLYNHSTVPLTQEEEELQELQAAAGNAT